MSATPPEPVSTSSNPSPRQGPRLLDMHIKDLRSLSDKDSQCRVGEGAMPVVAIFKQLKKMKYQGMVNLEYEIEERTHCPE